MKLYTTPGGHWCGTEKAWIAAMKAEGGDPKKYDGRKIVEVPTDKPGLMEFLTFHGVNVINPQPLCAAAVPEVAPAEVTPSPLPPAGAAPDGGQSTTVSNLDEAFENAPIRQQLRLAVSAIDRVDALVASPVYQAPAAA